MQKITLSFLGVFVSAMPFAMEAQGTFQNLNFESANVPATPFSPGNPVYVSTSLALPGWAAYFGTQQQAQVGNNVSSAGEVNISLVGPSWNSQATFETRQGIIDGQYSVVIQSGVPAAGPEEPENASISQTGTVPLTAESLQFDAAGPTSTLSVSFAGNVLSPVALSSGVSADGLPYTVFGANISAWAGDTGPLTFTALDTGGSAPITLDDITFSTQTVIPEPSPLVLTGIGGLVFALYRRFAPKRP